MNASILLLPGDGIGPEVVAAAASVLRAVASRFGHQFDLHEAAHRRRGAPARAAAAARRDARRRARGATRSCSARSAIRHSISGDSTRRPETALLPIRRELQLYANLRPAKVWPGLEIVRAAEADGRRRHRHARRARADRRALLRRAARHCGRRQRPRTTRCAIRGTRSSASRAARSRPPGTRRKRVMSVDKANVLETSRLWRQVVTRSRPSIRTSTLDHMYVDSCAMRIALAPASFDVILTENMFGDILSDEAGAIVGSLGLAAVREPRRRPRPLRTSARLCARHRRQEHRQPDRRDRLGRDAAAARARARDRSARGRGRRSARSCARAARTADLADALRAAGRNARDGGRDRSQRSSPGGRPPQRREADVARPAQRAYSTVTLFARFLG